MEELPTVMIGDERENCSSVETKQFDPTWELNPTEDVSDDDIQVLMEDSVM